MDIALWISPGAVALGSALDPSGSPSLTDYGVTGLVASIFLAGVIWAVKRLLAAKDEQVAAANERGDQEKARADRLENELSKLNATTQAQLATLQTQWLAAVQESQRAVAEAIASIRRAR